MACRCSFRGCQETQMATEHNSELLINHHHLRFLDNECETTKTPIYRTLDESNASLNDDGRGIVNKGFSKIQNKSVAADGGLLRMTSKLTNSLTDTLLNGLHFAVILILPDRNEQRPTRRRLWNESVLMISLLLSSTVDGGNVQTSDKPKKDELASDHLNMSIEQGSQALLVWTFTINDTVNEFTIIKDGNPVLTYLRKDLVMLPPGNNRYGIDTRFTFDSAIISLTITNVSVEDTGIYRCTLDLISKHQDIKLTVTGAAGFEWIPSTKDPVKMTLNQDIELTWSYKTNKRIQKILIYRMKNAGSQPENVGVWTVGNGYKPDPFLSTEVHFSKNFTNDGGKVGIKLMRAIYKDFDLIYFCHVYCEGSFDFKQGIEVTSHRPKCETESRHVEAREKEVAVFKWSFEYSYKVVAVLFWLETSNSTVADDIGYWYMNKFELYSRFEGKFSFNKSLPDINGKEFITLKLLRVTRGDFNTTYFCKIVHSDGQQSLCDVTLTQKFDPGPGDVKGDETLSQTSKTHTLGLVLSLVVLTIVAILLMLVLVYLRNKMGNRAKKRCAANETKCTDGDVLLRGTTKI